MIDLVKQHKIYTLVIVVLLIAAAWYGFTQTSAPPALSTTVTSDTNPQDQQLVTTLLTLQAVSLNGTIFSDPGFVSLKDFTTQIVSEPVGRPDPFAPLPPGALLHAVSSQGSSNPNLFAPATH
jgi:hypothetical protein